MIRPFPALSALLACLILSVPALPHRAQAGPLLFQDYAWDASRDELAAREGVFDCSKELGPGALCLSGLRYLDRDWEVDFAFTQGRLRAVSLFTLFDREIYARTFAEAVRQSALVYLQSADKELDLTALLVEYRDAPSLFDRLVTEFEAQGMAEGGLAYLFLNKEAMAEAATSARSLKELLAGAEPDILQTVLVLSRLEGRDWLTLIYEYPKLAPGPYQQP